MREGNGNLNSGLTRLPTADEAERTNALKVLEGGGGSKNTASQNGWWVKISKNMGRENAEEHTVQCAERAQEDNAAGERKKTLRFRADQS